MTDTAQLALIAMVGATLSAIIIGYFKLQTMDREAKQRSEANAIARQADSEKRDGVLQQIHVLVNNQFSEAMKKISDLMKQISDRDPHDIAKADAAQKAADVVTRKLEADVKANALLAAEKLKPLPPPPASGE